MCFHHLGLLSLFVSLSPDHAHSPGWLPVLCVAWCLIWRFTTIGKSLVFPSHWMSPLRSSNIKLSCAKRGVTPCRIAPTDEKRKRLFSIRSYQFAYVACMLVVWWHAVKCVPHQLRLDQSGGKFEHAQKLERTSSRKGPNWLCARHAFYTYLVRLASCTYQFTFVTAPLMFGGPWFATDYNLTCNAWGTDEQRKDNGWVTWQNKWQRTKLMTTV